MSKQIKLFNLVVMLTKIDGRGWVLKVDIQEPGAITRGVSTEVEKQHRTLSNFNSLGVSTHSKGKEINQH